VAADTQQQKVIRNKIRGLGFYASDFGLSGGYDQNDFLRVTKIASGDSVQKPQPEFPASTVKEIIRHGRSESDEHYVLGLCDQLLSEQSLRQHRFSFLTGDSGTALPVDAYYPALKLVIEYHERQHTDAVDFWDRKPTVSGLPRAEQRRIYDQRRSAVLPANGIKYLVIGYQELAHKASSKKLLRDIHADTLVLKDRLKQFTF
jgi:hypothetical protein